MAADVEKWGGSLGFINDYSLRFLLPSLKLHSN
jgi:hypothetical protein